MSSLETTEMKLRSTPTGGVAGEHSPYYRRLLSAGYKGFMQGTLGGAGFYGFLGLAVGTLIAVPAMILVPGLGLGALMMIPAAGGLGVVKGASTFGNIGSVAAISAESADLAEQRRYLLDRYYDLPEGPEGDKQAEIIKQELANMQDSARHHPVFHWKTVAICAAIGGALALTVAVAVATGGMSVFADTALFHAVETVLQFGGAQAVGHAVGGHLLVSGAAVTGIGTAVGALAGATIGLDRHYVRTWFDGSEKLLHDEAHSREALHARERQVERLREAAKADDQTKLILDRQRGLTTYTETPEIAPAAPMAAAPMATVAADKPTTKITSPQLDQRLIDIKQAMQAPAL